MPCKFGCSPSHRTGRRQGRLRWGSRTDGRKRRCQRCMSLVPVEPQVRRHLAHPPRDARRTATGPARPSWTATSKIKLNANRTGLLRILYLLNDGGLYVPLGQGIVWSGPLLAQETVNAGETLRLRQRFHSSRPLVRDLAVSLRLVGYAADGFTWEWAALDEAFGVPV